MPNIQRWLEDVRRWGLLRSLHMALMRRLGRWLTVCGVYARPVDGDYIAPSPPAGLDVRVATVEELDRACAAGEVKLAKPWVDAALGRGDLCVATFLGERIVAYMWRSFTTAPHLHGLWAAGYVRVLGHVYPVRSAGARRHGFGFFPHPKPQATSLESSRRS